MQTHLKLKALDLALEVLGEDVAREVLDRQVLELEVLNLEVLDLECFLSAQLQAVAMLLQLALKQVDMRVEVRLDGI